MKSLSCLRAWVSYERKSAWNTRCFWSLHGASSSTAQSTVIRVSCCFPSISTLKKKTNNFLSGFVSSALCWLHVRVHLFAAMKAWCKKSVEMFLNNTERSDSLSYLLSVAPVSRWLAALRVRSLAQLDVWGHDAGRSEISWVNAKWGVEMRGKRAKGRGGDAGGPFTASSHIINTSVWRRLSFINISCGVYVKCVVMHQVWAFTVGKWVDRFISWVSSGFDACACVQVNRVVWLSGSQRVWCCRWIDSISGRRVDARGLKRNFCSNVPWPRSASVSH